MGCITTDSVTLIEPPPFCEVIISNTVPLCAGDCDITLTAAVSAGTPPFQYFWSTMETSTNITNQCAGFYSVVLTDSLGCTDTAMVTITEPDSLQLTLQSIGTSCAGCNNGELISNITGGTPPFVISVMPLALTCEHCYNMPPGIYMVCVTDSNGCTTCVSDSIAEDPTSVSSLRSTNGWQVSLYPNPSSGKINLDVNSKNDKSGLQLEIFNGLGQIIGRSKFVHSTSLDFSSEKKGWYQVKITSTDGSFVSGRILIQ
jgi:hypothetical protein